MLFKTYKTFIKNMSFEPIARLVAPVFASYVYLKAAPTGSHVFDPRFHLNSSIKRIENCDIVYNYVMHVLYVH